MQAHLIYLALACALLSSCMLVKASSELDFENLDRLKKFLKNERQKVFEGSYKFTQRDVYEELNTFNRSVNYQMETLNVYIDRALAAADRMENRLEPYLRQFSRDADKIALTAAYRLDPMDVVNGGTVLYSTLEQSFESRFDTLQSIFYAPFRGTYLFMLSVAPEYSTTDTILLEIVKNGNEVFGTILSDKHPVTNMFMTELIEDDQVHVRMVGDAGKIRGGRETRFAVFSV